MGIASYTVIECSPNWSVLHDGNIEGSFLTKEAAFEAAVTAASIAIRQGHEVEVRVPATNLASDKGTTGIAARG